MMMAIARLNLPAVFLYGGSIMPGNYRGRDVNYVDVVEAVGAVDAGTMSEAELLELERVACPGPAHAPGCSLPTPWRRSRWRWGSRSPSRHRSPPSILAVRISRVRAARRSSVLLNEGQAARHHDSRGLRERHRGSCAVGGSTNVVLHLLAIAHDAGVDVTIDDFDRISRRTPHIADFKPSGKYNMAALDKVGGLPVVMRELLDAGLLHGDCLTVTGKTVAENLADTSFPDGQDVVYPSIRPSIRTAATRSSTATSRPKAGAQGREKTFRSFRGPARVFDSEQECFRAVAARDIKEGDVVIVRYEGPRGGPGMREMLAVTGALAGQRLYDKVLCITDGRFSGGTRAGNIAHVDPEAADGGPIALVHEGDSVTLDVEARTLNVEVNDAELERRRKDWTPPPPRYTTGALAKYARIVGPASKGAITT